jgi:LasA protease
MPRLLSVTATRLALALSALGALALTCPRAEPSPTMAWTLVAPWTGEAPTLTATPSPTITPTPNPLLSLFVPTRLPGQAYETPTPDAIRPVPTVRSETLTYVVRPGDSLSGIAIRFAVGANLILAANSIPDPDFLPVGQVLLIPPPSPLSVGPSFKVIPDSELVYGPSSALFDLESFAAGQVSYLNHYSQEVEGEMINGPEIVQLVAERYSVNPRLLLAILEHQSGWVTQPSIAPETVTYPIGFVAPGYDGLWAQLSWTADELNAGYYLWRTGWAGPFVLADGNTVPPGPGINAGTASVQRLFGIIYSGEEWRQVVEEGGFYQTYLRLFGSPFDWSVEPIVPPDLTQVAMQLPFEDGATWSFTSGPHAAWGAGTAWAALDFAPPGFALGCVPSDEWVVAAADGEVVRAGQGEVIQDLDGDGLEQTGWVLLYMHIESRDRVQPGTYLHAGDRIGHPSCEGGISNGTHLHLARRYNGEWIAADGPIPFDLDGWISAGLGQEYDGTLTRGRQILVACDCRFPGNQVTR